MNPNTIDPQQVPSLPLKKRSRTATTVRRSRAAPRGRSQLPSCPAIYFVLAEERILYIGQTVNLS
ncbi:hypothetical protein [Scytonema sp. PCC 10023]|uniref:hypothetical protein n=1 Tax=Scytonema sp. PCC 10023 TaxID=1680591 RepID=UPI0039C7516B